MKAIYAIPLPQECSPQFAAAQAAEANYFLKIEGIEGEAEIASWSFGVCNSGQCSTVKSPRDAASGLATGKRQQGPARVAPSMASDGKTAAPKGSWDLATGKARARQAGAMAEARRARSMLRSAISMETVLRTWHLAGTQSEISNLSVVYHKIEADWRRVCQGKHFDKVVLRSAADSFELSDVTVSCDAAPSSPAERRRDTCTSNDLDCRAVSDGTFVMRFTGGRMTNAKTGHVTLIKQ